MKLSEWVARATEDPPEEVTEPDIQLPEPLDGIFVDVARAEKVPPSWIVKDLLPPGLTFLAGPPKSMKSTITAAIAALVAEYPCHALPIHLSETHRHGPVLWFSAEALAGEIHDIMEVGLGLGHMEAREAILVAEDPWAFRLDDKDALDRMMTWLARRDPRLVIIDPLRDFHSGEERDSGVMNRLLRPLRQWAIKHDSAVIIVHHTKKLSDDLRDANLSAQDMRGTSALFGIADGVLILTPKKNGNIYVDATFKRAPRWEREIQLAVYGTEVARDVVGDIETQVITCMSQGMSDFKDIANHLHIGPGDVLAILGKVQQRLEAQEVAKKGQPWTTRTVVHQKK